MNDLANKMLCTDWSLNVDEESKKQFWWNNTYAISIWETSLGILGDKALEEITDTIVWRKYIRFQLNNVFKLCPICRGPEYNEEMKICCYCARTIHKECSVEAHADQIAWKSANEGFDEFMCVCLQCDNIEVCEFPMRPQEKESVKKAVKRVLSLGEELPCSIRECVQQMQVAAEEAPYSLELMTSLQRMVQQVFQSEESLQLLSKRYIESKNGGVGIIATQDIPAFFIIGLYPGYNDVLSGEQAKMGRPCPKYALMDLNCADFSNKVFAEFQETFTPFINEPSEEETSNCAWIQEPKHAEGRLSIISVREIKKGEELLIGYGPLYSRNYPYRYDAYAFHPVEGYTNPICYALWRWPTLDEKDAIFVCYIGYDKCTDRYLYWESQEEFDHKQVSLNTEEKNSAHLSAD